MLTIRKDQVQEQLHFILCVSFAFFLPISPKLLPKIIVLLLLNAVLFPFFNKELSLKSKAKTAVLLATPYFLYVAGILYSANTKYGLFDLEVKLSLLVFPLIFFLLPTFTIKRSETVLVSFFWGNLVALVVCFAVALTDYFSTGLNHFFYMDFSRFIHPSYFAMYLNLAIGIIVLKLISSSFINNRLRFLLRSSVLVFSLGVVLLASKLGLLTLILIYLVLFFYLVISRIKKVKELVVILVLIGSLITAISFTPVISERFYWAKKALVEGTTNTNESESSSVRLLIWKGTLSLSLEHFWTGVGTGDIKDELMKFYKKSGMNTALELKLNPHNQFLETFLAIGIFGLLSLLASLIIPAYYQYKAGNYYYFIFAILIFLNFLTESMLETQAGTVFFGFFASFFSFSTFENRNT